MASIQKQYYNQEFQRNLGHQGEEGVARHFHPWHRALPSNAQGTSVQCTGHFHPWWTKHEAAVTHNVITQEAAINLFFVLNYVNTSLSLGLSRPRHMHTALNTKNPVSLSQLLQVSYLPLLLGLKIFVLSESPWSPKVSFKRQCSALALLGSSGQIQPPFPWFPCLHSL